MSQVAMQLGDPSLIGSATADARHRTARIIFLGALASNAALTVFWLVTYLRGGSLFYSDYSADWATISRILSGVLFFYVIWGIIWWAVKSALLRYFVGFSKEDRRAAFSSRMHQPYDVSTLTAKYSERRIRIVDMIGRRGRFITLAAAGFFYLYARIAQNESANFATGFLQDNLLGSLISSWIFLGFYYVDGLLGAFFYGPQSRGIKAEDLDRLFVEFQQLDASTAKHYKGTGLGLALTKRIVEAQGGSVGVQTEFGVGSTFYAQLPKRVTARSADVTSIDAA